ncbi:MAG: TrkH family potassium uptake protein [Trueperaceae bacterium]|nr:TrkH family potassium uptake protein [Trueperaceae bacterium]
MTPREAGDPRVRGRFAPRILGAGLTGLGGLAAAFALAARLVGDPWTGFAATAVVGLAAGTLLNVLGRADGDPSRREALVSVLTLWLLVPLVGSMPYWVGGALSPVDALFESMSGFTATGATVLSDFGALGPTTFVWRALSQWIGAIGIIVLFVAVFPQLAIAGRQLFFTEAPGPTEDRMTPRLRNTATAVLLVYAGLTLAAGIAYLATGLGPYQAFTHALTTMAAGGFSPEARSFEGFSAATQWAAIPFMALAGVSFTLQFRAWSGRPRALWRDTEFRTYLAILGVAAAALTWLLWPSEGGSSLRHALFQSVSILTTTGYASTDFADWHRPAQTVLLLLMFIGGSAGSAAGGIKVVRLLIVARHTAREVQRVLHPRAVLPVRVGRRTVPEEVLRAVAAFITLYVALFATLTTTLVMMGNDYVTAFSASIAALGNVGPAIGAVGPMAGYAVLSDPATLLLTFAMYAGRLEVVVVFVVFTFDWWRLPRSWRPWR